MFIRKNNIVFYFIVIILCLVPLYGLGQDNMAKGAVYWDKNGNGKRDNSEPGLADIGVSNGRDVLLTDKNGNYSISIKNGDQLFVIKPAGFGTQMVESYLPSFYYNYNPNGSPKQLYPGIVPTGKLPNAIDFGLVKQKEEKSFRIMVFGDPQALSSKEIDYFNRGIIDDVLKNKESVSFGFTMGDITYDDLSVIEQYKEKMKRIGIQWYHTGGNHDINFDATSDEFSTETFKSHFGPITFSFNYADVHFIVANNVIYKGGTYKDKGSYQGGFRKSQLEFIKNDLKYVPKDKLVVLISHIPFVGREGNPTIRKNDLNELFTLLKDYKYTFSIAAHTHTQNQRFVKAPYLKDSGSNYHHQYNVGTTSGNLYSGVLDKNGLPPSTMADGTPIGYAFINFNGTNYSIDYKVAGKTKDYRMHVQMPKVLLKHEKTRANLYVNYYLGGDLDTLSFRVNDGEWNLMTRVLESDPCFQNTIFQWDNSDKLLNGKRPTPAALSTHLWKGMIYGEGELGKQRVEIKVKDMFGREFTEIYIYELVEN